MSTAFILTMPAAGHILPCVPIARELVARGERVVFPAPSSFRDAILAAGAEFRAFNCQIDRTEFSVIEAAIWRLQVAERVLPRLAVEMKAAAADYLLIDYSCLWGYILGQHFSIPVIVLYSTDPGAFNRVRKVSARVVTCVDLIRHPRGWRKLPSYRQLARTLASRWDVACPDSPVQAILPQGGDLHIVTTSRQLGAPQSPPGTEFHFVGPSIRDAGMMPGEELPPRGARPMIYVSLGTYWNRNVEFYRECIRAFGGDSYDVVIVTGGGIALESVAPLSQNVHIRNTVDQIRALAGAALFVSHGGMNGVCESLLAGVPLLLCPQAMDQHATARYVQSLGAGLTVGSRTPRAEELSRLAGRLLREPSFRARAAQIGNEMRAEEGPRVAVDLVFALRAQFRSRLRRPQRPTASEPLRRHGRVMRIVRRRRRSDSLMVAAPSDFLLKDVGGIDEQAVLQRPDLTLYCVDAARRRALFIQADMAQLRGAPFLYQAQARSARGLVSVPYESLAALASSCEIDPERLVFIYSTGRCGSTLVSRAFEAVPDGVSLSEPDVFTQLVSQRVRGVISDAELQSLLRSCVLLQCAPYWRAGRTSVIALKFRSYVIELADLLQAAFPRARLVFIYRDAVSYFRSATFTMAPWIRWCLRMPAPRMHWWYARRVRFVREHHARRARILSPAQLMACTWAAAMQIGLKLNENGMRVFTLRYEELAKDPARVFAALFAFCGIDQWGDLQAIIDRDSQKGTSLARDRRRHRDSSVSEPEIKAMLSMLAECGAPIGPDLRIPGTFELPVEC